MANATSFLKPSTMVVPLQFSDSGRIDFRFLRYSTDVYHTLWCYIVDKNGNHIQDEQHNDIRILLANEDNINWDVPSSFPNYRFSLPETAAELFDFSTPDNCYVDFAIFTYSSSTYSGSSIIGTEWFSDYSEIVKVQPSNKMYPQIRLIITDETKAYKNTGGKYFYLDNDASQTDLSSNGNIKVEINYYSGHEPAPGTISQDFCQINGQQAPAAFTNNGLNYNRNTTISGTSIIGTESKTNFRISVTDGQNLNSEYTTSVTWANTIPATKFNDLKELSEDDLRYDYKLGTPVPTSLYLDPDWTATQYTTAPVPDDWEYYADIGDNGTGLINQRDILNDQKRQLNLQLFRKYYRYIQEGTWLDDSYIDDNLYYLDANKILNQSSYPKATYTIDVVDINGIKKYAAYEFTLGQRTYVEDPDMFGYVYNTVAGGEVKTPFRKEVIISERSRNLDDPSKSTIKVQTYKNQWEDIFSSLTATTQSLQYASGGYARAANAVNPNGSINVHSLEQTFQQGDFALSGSATQSITWDGSYGIEIADMSNSLIKLRIASNGLAITTDGGATWNNAITGNGINTNYLLAGQIDASKINIISKEGDYAFNWNEKGLNAVLPLQEGDDPDDAGNSYVRFNDLGIYGTMEGADIDDWEESNEDASIAERIAYIKEHSTFFLGWEGLTLREIDGNVINLNPDVGLEIFNNENNTSWKWTQEKISGTNFNVDTNGDTYEINDLIPVLTLGEFHYIDDQSQDVKVYGLLVRNQDGVPTLYTDEDGDLTMTGNITANNGFLKRLYLETVNRTSYLGTNKDDDATIAADDILISLGKTKSNDVYSPGKFIVRADGKYFGELAALSYVSDWDSNSQASYSNENTEPNQNAYAILLGPHSEGSGASQVNYIMSVFNSNTQTAQMQRVFDIRNDGTVDLEGVLNARNGVQLTGSLRAYTDSDNTLSYIEINGEDGTIGHSTNSWFIDKTGYAEFQNAKIRGTLSTVVFEKEKVSMVGGDLVISPTIYLEEDTETDGQGWFGLSESGSKYFTDGDLAIVYIANNEQEDEFEGQYYFGQAVCTNDVDEAIPRIEDTTVIIDEDTNEIHIYEDDPLYEEFNTNFNINDYVLIYLGSTEFVLYCFEYKKIEESEGNEEGRLNLVLLPVTDNQIKNEIETLYSIELVSPTAGSHSYTVISGLHTPTKIKPYNPSRAEELEINLLYSININTSWPSGLSVLPAGSQITRANLKTNAICLTANQQQGATIKVMGSGSSGAQAQLGYIYFDGGANTEMRQLAQGKYGLYADNVFLEGIIYATDGRFSGQINATQFDAPYINFGDMESNYIIGNKDGNDYTLDIKLDNLYFETSDGDLDVLDFINTTKSLLITLENGVSENAAQIVDLNNRLVNVETVIPGIDENRQSIITLNSWVSDFEGYIHLEENNVTVSARNNLLFKIGASAIQIQNNGTIISSWADNLMTSAQGYFQNRLQICGFEFVMVNNNLRLRKVG